MEKRDVPEKIGSACRLHSMAHMSIVKSLGLAFTLALGAAAGACTGSIWSAEEPEHPTDTAGSAQCGVTREPGAAIVRRLTRFEYDNTVRDLLADTSGIAKTFAKEEVAYGFDNNAASLSVSPSVVIPSVSRMMAAGGVPRMSDRTLRRSVPNRLFAPAGSSLVIAPRSSSKLPVCARAALDTKYSFSL